MTLWVFRNSFIFLEVLFQVEFCPTERYVEVLILTPSECDLIWN